MGYLRQYRNDIMYQTDRQAIYDTARQYLGGFKTHALHDELYSRFAASPAFEALTGMVFGKGWEKLGIAESPTRARKGQPSFQVDDLRLLSRVGPDGNQVNQIIFSIMQTSGVIIKNGRLTGHFQPKENKKDPPDGYWLKGGCTLIFDLDKNELQYAIARPLLDLDKLKQGKRKIDEDRVRKLYDFQTDQQVMAMNDFAGYFGIGPKSALNEPFAFLHRI